MKEIKIRLLKKSEIPKLATVFMRAFNQSGFGDKWTQKTSEVYLKYWMKKQHDLFFVATENGQLIGGAVTEIAPWWFGNMMENTGLFVDPKHHKKGIGRLLLMALLKRCIDKYNAIVYSGLTTKKTKYPLAWYKKIGKHETDIVYTEGDAKEVLKNLEKMT